MKELWQRVTQSLVARNTAWMLLSQMGRLLIQAFYFILIARALGAEGFGEFAAMLALIFILVPFANWGSGNVLISHVARTPSCFPTYWGNALLTCLMGGTIFTILALGISTWLFPMQYRLVLLLAVAELFFGRILESSAQAFQAFQRLRVTAQLYLLLSGARLIAAIGFVNFSNNLTPDAWAMWYLISTAISSILGFALATQYLGVPRPIPSLILLDFKEGFHFSMGLASRSAHVNIDKTLLARLATLEATGIYAAAHRLVSIVFTPVNSLLSSTYARFFQQGVEGIEGSYRYAIRLLPFASGYGLLASVGLMALAPVVPYLLGNEYRESVEVIRWLSLLPFLQSLHYFAADSLTGAGYQGVRSRVQVGTALLSVMLNLWLIPLYSWRGAALATLTSEAALVFVLWSIVGLKVRKSREGYAVLAHGDKGL